MRKEIVQEKKSIGHRKEEMRRRGAQRSPDEIPYFKKVALDRGEDPLVKREALVALGNLGERSLKPLKDISEEADPPTAASARKLLDAFYKNKRKPGWSSEAEAMLNDIVEGLYLMVEEPAT